MTWLTLQAVSQILFFVANLWLRSKFLINMSTPKIAWNMIFFNYAFMYILYLLCWLHWGGSWSWGGKIVRGWAKTVLMWAKKQNKLIVSNECSPSEISGHYRKSLSAAELESGDKKSSALTREPVFITRDDIWYKLLARLKLTLIFALCPSLGFVVKSPSVQHKRSKQDFHGAI